MHISLTVFLELESFLQMDLVILQEKLEFLIFLMKSLLESYIIVHHVLQLLLIYLLLLFLKLHHRSAFREN